MAINVRRIRFVGLTIAGLLALYMVLGFFAVPALLKRQLVSHVEHELKHKLTLAEVRFNPLALRAELDDFDLRDPGGAPLLSFKRLRVDFQSSSMFRRAWTFAEISLESPSAIAEIRKDGTLNFDRLLAALRSPDPQPQAELPRLLIDRIGLSGGTVMLADLQAGEHARLRIAPIDFELTELSTLPSGKSPYKLSARTSDGESISWTGEISLNPIASSGSLKLGQWRIETLTKLLGGRIAAGRAAGTLEIALGYRASYDKGVVKLAAANGEMRIAGLALAAQGTDTPVVQLQTLDATGLSFDFEQRLLSAERVELGKGRIGILIAADGRTNLEALLPARRETPAAADRDTPAPAASNAAAPAATPPWRVKIARVQLAEVGMQFADQRADRMLTVNTEGAGLTLAADIEHAPGATRIDLHAVKFGLGTLAVNQAALGLSSGAIGLDVAAIKTVFGPNGATFDAGTAKLVTAALKMRQGNDEVGIDQSEVTAQSARMDLAAGRIETQGVSVATGRISGRLAGDKADTVALKSMAFSAATLGVMADPIDARAQGVDATLSEVAVRDPRAGNELARLGRVDLAGGQLRLGERLLAAERLTLADGFGTATIGADGKLNWDTLRAAFAPQQPKPAAANAPANPPAGGAWKMQAKAIEVRNFGAALADQTQSPPLAMTLQEVNARAQNVDTGGQQFAQVDLRGKIKEGGHFSATGRVHPVSMASDLKVTLADLSLVPAQTFIAPHARLQIVSALSSAQGRVRYGDPKGSGAALVFEGEFDLTKLRIDETEPAQSFLTLDALKATQIRLAMNPNRLEIPEMRISGLATKLLIAEDQSVNITKVLRPRAGTDAKAPAAGKPQSAAQPVTEAPPDDPFPASISRIRVDNSILEFSDLSLRPQFATRMYELKGVITGIATARDTRAQLELDARVDEFGSARIRGDINLFKPRAYTDVDMNFRNLEMTALTPYSAKFAGYRIASGRLSMDLQYRIKDSALAGENKIVLDKLELGERVESPTALNLPLELAIAILKDSDGRIDIGLPVSGNLDDPQFSYGALVWKAIGNLLTRIVTAPFRALASLFGGGAEKLDTIEFDPGNDRLQPPERQKLRTVAEALAKRPQLKLTIKPGYAPGIDRPNMQATAVRHAVHTRSGIKIEPGEAPGPIDFNNTRSQQAVQALFEEKFGAPALRDLRAALAKPPPETAASGAKPAAPPADRIYRVMTERLTDTFTVSDAELQALAVRRAEAIAKEIAAAGKVDSARVTTGAAQESSADGARAVSVALELGVAK